MAEGGPIDAPMLAPADAQYVGVDKRVLEEALRAPETERTIPPGIARTIRGRRVEDHGVLWAERDIGRSGNSFEEEDAQAASAGSGYAPISRDTRNAGIGRSTRKRNFPRFQNGFDVISDPPISAHAYMCRFLILKVIVHRRRVGTGRASIQAGAPTEAFIIHQGCQRSNVMVFKKFVSYEKIRGGCARTQGARQFVG